MTREKVKKVKFDWTQGCQESFDKIKDQLIAIKSLAYQDINKHYSLYVYASQTHVGRWFAQKSDSLEADDNKEKPINFLSHTLSDTQRRWRTIKKQVVLIK